VLYALFFGCILPMTVRMNAGLGGSIGQLPGAVAVHVIGGLFGLACVLPFVGRDWVSALPRTPWWAFLGGIVGTFLVVLANRAVLALGTAGFTAVNVAMQLVVSALLDHYGLLGAEQASVTLPRVGGMILLGVGAALVVRG
jgi:transporter family-2 protein